MGDRIDGKAPRDRAPVTHAISRALPMLRPQSLYIERSGGWRRLGAVL